MIFQKGSSRFGGFCVQKLSPMCAVCTIFVPFLLAAAKNLHSKMSGNYLARSKGRGMEFDEVRHYQNGDDIRAIDWRVTARTGKTHTKLFKEEVERPVLIATDLSENMLFGSQLLFKSVQAAHLASLVAWHAKSRGDRVGGIVFNQHYHAELKPRSRLQGVLHYLHILSQVHHKSIKSHMHFWNRNLMLFILIGILKHAFRTERTPLR